MKLSLALTARSFASRRLACSTLLTVALAGLGCSDGSEDSAAGPSQAQVVSDYAALVEASYAASLSEAKALRDAIRELVEAPTANTLEDAKEAWLKSRDPYGETEAFRFYQGPI